MAKKAKSPNKGGRPKGTKTRKKTISVTLLAGGVLPVDMVLKTARKMWAEAVDEDGEVQNLRKAKAAALFGLPAIPYTSHRLQAISYSTTDKGGDVPMAAQMALDTIALARQLMAQHLPASHPALIDVTPGK